MATIRQIHHPANVLQVSPVTSEEEESDKETSSRPICAVNQVAVGPFLDVDTKVKSLWYFGPFAKHVAYIWAASRSSPWFMEWKGLYQNPCKGCRRCQVQEKEGGSHEEGSGTSRWWHAFVRPTRDRLKSSQKTVEQDIINPDCGIWHDISLQSVFLEVRASDPAMEMCYIPAQISRWSFIHLGVYPDDRRDVCHCIPVSEVQLKPLSESEGRSFFIDNEVFDVRPIHVKFLQGKVNLYSGHPCN